ncbi:MAG: hypothetical protein ACYC0V_07490 [Armatimonadota bacterium]
MLSRRGRSPHRPAMSWAAGIVGFGKGVSRNIEGLAMDLTTSSPRGEKIEMKDKTIT